MRKVLNDHYPFCRLHLSLDEKLDNLILSPGSSKCLYPKTNEYSEVWKKRGLGQRKRDRQKSPIAY